jgi:fused signal recognition particle receptor
MGILSSLKKLFSNTSSKDDLIDQLEELLIQADIGTKTTYEIIEALEKSSKKSISMEDFTAISTDILQKYLKSQQPTIAQGKLNILLFLGVNGVGKTTSIAKLIQYYSNSIPKEKIIVAAADTFRAAAIEQLEKHGERLGVRVVAQQHGSDPGAVVFDALQSAQSKQADLLIIDTAGRMHTKSHLVKELQKIDKIIAKNAGESKLNRILVIDATTGQNALRQAEVFSEAVEIDGIFLSKVDSHAKGGIILPIFQELGIPVAFLGKGEKYEDLEEFDSAKFINNLLELDN